MIGADLNVGLCQYFTLFQKLAQVGKKSDLPKFERLQDFTIEGKFSKLRKICRLIELERLEYKNEVYSVTI